MCVRACVRACVCACARGHVCSARHDRSRAVCCRCRAAGVFGTALTLSDRPFLSELWPDLECVPMGASMPDDDEVGRAARARTLEVFLDRVCVEASASTSHHLLDQKFVGTFTNAEVALRAELAMLVDDLRSDPLARRSEAFETIMRMLREQGYSDSGLSSPIEDVPVGGDDAQGSATAAAPRGESGLASEPWSTSAWLVSRHPHRDV